MLARLFRLAFHLLRIYNPPWLTLEESDATEEEVMYKVSETKSGKSSVMITLPTVFPKTAFVRLRTASQPLNFILAEQTFLWGRCQVQQRHNITNFVYLRKRRFRISTNYAQLWSLLDNIGHY